MNSATSDPLINHLRLLTEHLGHGLPEADLFRVFKGKPDAYAVEDAVSALEVAGYRADFGKARLLKLDPILFAVLAFDAEGSPFVVLEREDKDRFPVIDASTGSSELQIWRRQDQRPSKARGVLRAAWRRTVQRHRALVLAAVVTSVLGLATSPFKMVVYDHTLPNEAVDSLLALVAGVGFVLLFWLSYPKSAVAFH